MAVWLLSPQSSPASRPCKSMRKHRTAAAPSLRRHTVTPAAHQRQQGVQPRPEIPLAAFPLAAPPQDSSSGPSCSLPLNSRPATLDPLGRQRAPLHQRAPRSRSRPFCRSGRQQARRPSPLSSLVHQQQPQRRSAARVRCPGQRPSMDGINSGFPCTDQQHSSPEIHHSHQQTSPRPCTPSSPSTANLDSHQQTSAQAASEQRVLPIHASPSSESGTVAFSSTLATLPCSPTAKSGTTASTTATRPATTRFPDVSVSPHLSLIL